MVVKGLLVLAVSFVSSIAIAHASFPGENGSITVSLEGSGGCYSTYLRSYAFDGRFIGPLTIDCEVVRVDPDEFEVTRSTWGADWAADGSRLFYVESVESPSRIMSMDASGGDRIALPLPQGADAPSVSPGGRRIAFWHRGEIWSAHLDGTSLRRLQRRPPCPGDAGNCVDIGGPRWSPDGRSIAFFGYRNCCGDRLRPGLRPGVWLMRARSGRVIRRLARDGVQIDWSPDARSLVYRTSSEAFGAGGIVVVNADGSGRHWLIRNRPRRLAIAPTWSPDSKWITWISLRRRGSSDLGFSVRPTIWRVHPAGGRPRFVTRLPEPAVDEGEFVSPNLAWQPLPQP